MEGRLIALVEGIVVAAVIILIGQGIDKEHCIMPETDQLEVDEHVAFDDESTNHLFAI